MLCKNCSHWIKDGDTFCPNCGKKIKGNHPSAVKYIVMIGIAVIIFLIIKTTGKPPKETAIWQTVQETATIQEETKSTEELLIGVWKADSGEVTFTKNNGFMLGRDGLTLGNQWLNYEVIDDTTIYLSGDGIAAGINITYSLSDNVLYLELLGEYIIFTKK